MMTDNILDVHLASDVMSPRLEQRLYNLDFVKDAFIGGTPGVVHPCHYSKRPASHDLLVETWKETSSILSTTSASEFYGYAEAEVTQRRFQTPLTWKPFDSSVRFPFGRLDHQECPPNKHKHFDIHVTANLSSLSPDLKQLLEKEIAFNYVDIRKASDQVVRVYTFQPLGLKETPELYQLLVAYFQKAGGIQGKTKLEATFAYRRFPRTAPVPPIVTRMPTILQS